MAEYAVVSSVGRCLSAPATQEFCLLWNLEDEIERLKITHSRVQRVLEQNEIRQHMNELIDQNWYTKLKYAAYDAENILEQVEIESAERRCKYFPFLKFFYSFPFRVRMAHKVKKLRKTLDAIAEEGHKFPLSEAGGNPRYGVTPLGRETCSLVNESEIWGRQKEKEKIIEKLCEESSLQQVVLSVHAIWGMGGVGKTTLAQLVLNDKHIEELFDLRIWVCVSENFDVKRILKDMIESIDGKKCEDFDQLDALKNQLRKSLEGKKKFVLVLDDVWDVQSTTWETLMSILKRDLKGSAVIVTTRIHRTATMMATDKGVHHIGILSKADSWSLFQQRAFPNGVVNESSLVQIGKAIVKKCGGLPLAIKVLGSLMASKVSESDWLSIEESEIWTLLDNEERDEIPAALKLSYYNLRSDMKKCFAYCCIYPKDYVMEVDELVQLWMANGFLQSSNGQKDLPREGRRIYEELTWRCFFENNRTDRYSGKRWCKMHDLLHDLAKSIMGQEIRSTPPRFVVNDFESEIPRGLRHVGIFEEMKLSSSSSSSSSSAFNSNIQVSTANSLCSFIDPSFYVNGLLSDDLFSFLSKQQYLRALDIRWCTIRNLDLGCQLKHLKFLFISCRHMETLPESLTHLRNLQTLKLMNSNYIRELPKELRVMKNLCFLEMDITHSLESTPPELSKLASLCRLGIYIVGEDDALQQIDQLKELNKLGGRLVIRGLENVKSLEDAKSANLMAKPDLTRLILEWKMDSRRSEHCEEVLQGLQPHYNIEEVRILHYPGSKFHEWMGSSAYVKLTSVGLSGCRECECLPALGNLPSLTELSISRLYSLKRIGAEAEWYGDGKCSFPKLTTLTIWDMDNLEEWSAPDSDSVQISFPRLTKLDIADCPKLESIPSLSPPLLLDLCIQSLPKVQYFPESLITKSLTKLTISGCPQLEERYGKPNGEAWPKISHIPTIKMNERFIQKPDI